jgi:hypothetical protein
MQTDNEYCLQTIVDDDKRGQAMSFYSTAFMEIASPIDVSSSPILCGTAL